MNPLEVKPDAAAYRQDLEHVETHRVGWFDCACCPTNIARLIGSVAQYIYSFDSETVYLHQYIASKTALDTGGQKIALDLETNFPWDGKVRLHVDPDVAETFNLALRIPAWCSSFTLKVNDKPFETGSIRKGYLYIEREWHRGDQIELDLEMTAQFLQADSRAQGYAGKAALMRGPLVYCLEEKDNGALLQELVIDPHGKIDLLKGNLEPSPSIDIEMDAVRVPVREKKLYAPLAVQKEEPFRVKAIPYFQWGNRDENKEMTVWFRVK